MTDAALFEIYEFIQCVLLILIYIELKKPRVVINTIGSVERWKQ